MNEKQYAEYYKKILQLDSAYTRNNVVKILQEEHQKTNIEWNTKKHLFAFNIKY